MNILISFKKLPGSGHSTRIRGAKFSKLRLIRQSNNSKRGFARKSADRSSLCDLLTLRAKPPILKLKCWESNPPFLLILKEGRTGSMSSLKPRETQLGNRLLAALPRAEHERLLPFFELVRLTPGKILYDVGDTVRHAYFPKGGMISLLSITEDGRTIEVGMVGNEGMTGLPTVVRCNVAPYQVMVQFAGNALRIGADALRTQMSRSPLLQEILLCYSHALLIQVAQSAACNRFHSVQARLCRWLLVSHDRLTTNTLPLTQEFLSHMLGVPRTSVTAVARNLQEQELVRYSRGKIVIRNRAGLEIHSCECYRLVRNEIEQFLVA